MKYAYLTVTHEMFDGSLTGDPIELDATERTWAQLREDAYQRLEDYAHVRLVSAVLVLWSDDAFPDSAHPSKRVPTTYCFQPNELRKWSRA